jgi:hypothetical protein
LSFEESPKRKKKKVDFSKLDFCWTFRVVKDDPYKSLQKGPNEFFFIVRPPIFTKRDCTGPTGLWYCFRACSTVQTSTAIPRIPGIPHLVLPSSLHPKLAHYFWQLTVPPTGIR